MRIALKSEVRRLARETGKSSQWVWAQVHKITADLEPLYEKALSEDLSPEELVCQVNEYLGSLDPAVRMIAASLYDC